MWTIECLSCSPEQKGCCDPNAITTELFKGLKLTNGTTNVYMPEGFKAFFDSNSVTITHPYSGQSQKILVSETTYGDIATLRNVIASCMCQGGAGGGSTVTQILFNPVTGVIELVQSGVPTNVVGSIPPFLVDIREITDTDLVTSGSPVDNDVLAFINGNQITDEYIIYIGNGTATSPEYVWRVDSDGDFTRVEPTQGSAGSTSTEITDTDLGVAGSPTNGDVTTYAAANNLIDTHIYYIGNGTADDPDYVYYVDTNGDVINVDSPSAATGSEDILEITDADLTTVGSPVDADITAFLAANPNAEGYIYYVGTGTATNPQYAWVVDSDGDFIEVEGLNTVTGISTYDAGNDVQVTGSAGITTTPIANGEVEIIMPPGGVITNGCVDTLKVNSTYTGGGLSNGFRVVLDNSANGLNLIKNGRVLTYTGTVTAANKMETAVNPTVTQQGHEFAGGRTDLVFNDIVANSNGGHDRMKIVF